MINSKGVDVYRDRQDWRVLGPVWDSQNCGMASWGDDGGRYRPVWEVGAHGTYCPRDTFICFIIFRLLLVVVYCGGTT